MSKNHLLLTRAFVYKKETKLKDPENCEYHDKLGAWLWGTDKEFLVKSNDVSRPRPGTKKEDIETGEDLKAE